MLSLLLLLQSRTLAKKRSLGPIFPTIAFQKEMFSGGIYDCWLPVTYLLPSFLSNLSYSEEYSIVPKKVGFFTNTRREACINGLCSISVAFFSDSVGYWGGPGHFRGLAVTDILGRGHLHWRHFLWMSDSIKESTVHDLTTVPTASLHFRHW